MVTSNPDICNSNILGRRDTVTPLQYGSWPSAYMPSPTVQRHLEFAIPGLENGFEAFTSPPEIDLLRSRRFTENEIQELLKEGTVLLILVLI
jgi:hypothetical protein